MSSQQISGDVPACGNDVGGVNAVSPYRLGVHGERRVTSHVKHRHVACFRVNLT